MTGGIKLTMDEDYVRLSLLTGLFAGAADRHLGRTHFAAIVRPLAWDLTWELLASWKAQAVQMGVPTEALEPTAAEWQQLSGLIDWLRPSVDQNPLDKT
jgi:hypothetical protein